MNNGQRGVIHAPYKEESKARIQNDNDDLCIIRSIPTMCTDPRNDASLLGGQPLSKVVITMCSNKRHILVGQEKVYDQDLYGRVIGMLVSSRDINFDDVLFCELTAFPSSMLCADGRMYISKGKSILKKNIQVTISERNCSSFDTVIYDVSALLWNSVAHLPK